MSARPLAQLLAAVLLMAASLSCHRSPRAEPPFTPAQEDHLRRLMREELARAANASPADGGLDAEVAALVRQELDGHQWHRELGHDQLQRIIRRATRDPNEGNDMEAIDLSRISSVDGKVKRIIRELQTAKGQFWGSPLAAQLRELGPQAVPVIWANLREIPATRANWSTRVNLARELSPMLTAADEAIILEDIATTEPLMADAAIRLNLASAGDYALDRLREVTANPQQLMGLKTIELALHFKGREAVPLALERTLTSPRAPEVMDLVIERFPDLDIRRELVAASATPKGQTPDGRAYYTKQMLRRGMPEGLDLAIEALQRKTVDDKKWNNEQLEEVRRSIRFYVSKTGSDEELVQWITANRGRLRWNPARQMFE